MKAKIIAVDNYVGIDELVGQTVEVEEFREGCLDLVYVSAETLKEAGCKWHADHLSFPTKNRGFGNGWAEIVEE